MKNFTIHLLFVFILILFGQPSRAQWNGFDCCTFNPSGSFNLTSSPFEGRVKPNRTDTINGQALPTNAYFPVLVVFLQFKDEPTDPRGSWPMNGKPIFLDSIIATQKNTQGIDWWQKYNTSTEMLSSFWLEVSRGRFHVISPRAYGAGAFGVTLSKTALEYWIASGRDHQKAEQMVHREMWDSIRAQGLTDWSYYDRWKVDNNEFVYCDIGEGDGYVDMVYKVSKSIGGFNDNGYISSIFFGYAGYNQLGGNNFIVDTVDVTNNIKIDYTAGVTGSGVTVSYRGQKSQYVATMIHEHGHQLFNPAHVTYSHVSFGIGFDGFYSPYEMVLNNYMSPSNAVIGGTNTLGDYSSRNSGTGNLIKVSIQGDQFFLLAFRNKISKWDKVMLGDTAQITLYEDNSNCGKGLYIYHIENGIYFPGGDISPQDLECADGYYEWEFAGRGQNQVAFDCFLSPTPPHWKYYTKKTVLYSNDASPIDNMYPYGDELSFHHNINDTTWPCWWGVGKKPLSSCEIGVDRIFTNDTDIYCKSANSGDRWDPWYPGYNEVFSPYSSPSTCKWNNDTSQIFIYFKNISNGEAVIDIYRAGYNNIGLDSILKLTPPSRPMGLKVDVTDCIDDRRYPILTWNHNMEPDMLQGQPQPVYKRYKIYRAWEEINNVPGDYVEIGDTLIHINDNPSYIDYGTYAQCDYGTAEENYRLRYKIKAVDYTSWASVFSDFVSMSSYYLNRGDGDNFILNEGPKSFSLSQNYPNPFNPVTKINYSIPKQGLVTLKVYDILGREVRTLVNDVKTVGVYSVDFNGNDLSSGVYFYRIEAGDFVNTKRMVLIK